MHRVILVTSGPLEGEEFVVDAPIRIGRAGDTAIQLIGSSVSRHHAEVRAEVDGSTTLADLGSKNGTFLRGEAIERVTLRSGDVFEVGNSTFRLELREGPPPRPSEELQLSLVSGPAEDVTQMYNRNSLGLPGSRNPTTVPGAVEDGEACQDPLHEMARSRGWKYCPACGEAPDTQRNAANRDRE